MSFADCIQEHVKTKRLSKGKSDALLKKYSALKDKYEKAGQGAGAAEKAAQDIIKLEAEVILQKQRNLKQHALKIKQINQELDSKKGPIEQKVSDLYQRAAFRGEVVRKGLYSYMNQIAEDIKGDFFDLNRDHELFEQGIRSALGETVDNPKASQIGEVIRKTYDLAHSRHRAAGGILGKLNNYFPQSHRAEAIRRVDKDEWVDYLFDRVDREKMIDETTSLPFEDEKLRNILKDSYDDIITDGRSSIQKRVKEGKVTAGRGSDVDQRKNASRFIHFKNADAFLEYNAKFGQGKNGLIQSYLDSMDSFSRDIGLLETLGPKPDSMSKFLSLKMQGEGTSNIKKSWVDAEYKILRGVGGGSDSGWWNVLTGVQNWIRGSMLGSASISAMSDTAFIAATAKMNGLSATRALSKYGTLLSPVGGKELKKISRRSGYLVDVINGSVLSDTRFAGETMPGKFTGALARATNKLSGLHAMTKATQDAIALEYSATLADFISDNKSWQSLPKEMKDTFEKFNFNEVDWNNLRRAKVEDTGKGAKLLITQDLRVDPSFDTKTAFDLANKIDDITFSLRQMASNEGLLATKALTTGAAFGDGRPGSLSRAMASSLFMFKTFPITVMLTHLMPALRRVKTDRKLDHLMMITIGAGLMGSIPLILKDLVKGKQIDDPEKFFTPRFAFASMMQGGGLGLFGDFVLGDYSRFGRTPITEALGPMVGTVDDIFRATKGNLDRVSNGDDPDFIRDSFRVAKRNIPVVGSLWYTRLALERLMLDNLERLIDPKFDSRMRKMENKMIKEQGKKFWWRP